MTNNEIFEKLKEAIEEYQRFQEVPAELTTIGLFDRYQKVIKLKEAYLKSQLGVS